MKIPVYDMYKDRLNPPYLKETVSYTYEEHPLNDPNKVVKLMHEVFLLDSRSEEYVYVLALDTKCNLLGIFEVSHGTVSQSMISNREIFIRLLLCGASSFIMVHNHPSGDPNPSTEDFLVTEKVKQAADLMNIKLLDHIIIGYESTYSFKENTKLLN